MKVPVSGRRERTAAVSTAGLGVMPETRTSEAGPRPKVIPESVFHQCSTPLLFLLAPRN